MQADLHGASVPLARLKRHCPSATVRSLSNTDETGTDSRPKEPTVSEVQRNLLLDIQAKFEPIRRYL